VNESVKERTEMHHIPIFQNRVKKKRRERGRGEGGRMMVVGERKK